MNFVSLPESPLDPADHFDWFSFEARSMTLEEFAEETLDGIKKRTDSLITQAVWSSDWASLKVREIEKSYIATAQYAIGDKGKILLTGLFILPRTKKEPDLKDLEGTLASLLQTAQGTFDTWARFDKLLDPWRQTTRGSRTRRPDSAYAALALRYSQINQAGVKNPRKTLSDELGLSQPAISARVREARVMGFLSDSVHGIADGQLTPLGYQTIIQAVTT